LWVLILGFKLPNNNKVKIQAFKKKKKQKKKKNNNNNKLKKLPENNKVRFKVQKQQRQTEIQASKQHQSKIQAFKQQQNKIQASKTTTTTTTTEIQALKRTTTAKYSNRQQKWAQLAIYPFQKANGHLDFAQWTCRFCIRASPAVLSM
jgi:hypothetical protein